MEPAWIALAISLKVAGWSTAINLVLGVAAGFVLARKRFVGRELLDSVLTLPMVLPPTVLGYYLLVVIGKRGWLGAWLYEHFGINLIFSWQGAVIAAAIVAFPLVMKSARAAFEGVDPQLEKAARVLGLSEWALFFRVTLPMAWRGILAGVLLAFAR
ncbi:MAG: ABC transporter permease subunit, partial [Burkholderiales bacterium]